MQRLLYQLLLLLALPFVPLKLLWRSLKQPEYLQHWQERFGFFKQAVTKPIISIHCVSVGETHAAAPLIKALIAQYPNHQILITHGTPTGRETSEALFGDQVLRAYLPYDLVFAVNRFLKQFQPEIVILMETEIWFNLIQQCHLKQIPIVLINARLSAKSAAGYAKFNTLMQQGLQQLSDIHAQTEADAERFNHFGVSAQVSGHLKFDVAPKQTLLSAGKALRASIKLNKVFVAASTREGEEGLIIKAVQALAMPDLLTVIVPRHPQRFDAVADLLQAQGISFIRKSQLATESNVSQSIDGHWILGDTMGELATFYAAADVAFVGGSLLPLGGQNMIESCAMGVPTIVGPHTFNFEQVTKTLVAANAVKRVDDVEHLTQTLATLLSDTANAEQQRETMQEAGLNVVKLHQGATNNYLKLITAYVNP